jgi:hypothetical protein
VPISPGTCALARLLHRELLSPPPRLVWPRKNGSWNLCSGYNFQMARGWESKSVEEQQAASATPTQLKQRLTPDQIARQRQAEGLSLARKSVLQQLQSVQDPRHRQMLEHALADLDAKLARLG